MYVLLVHQHQLAVMPWNPAAVLQLPLVVNDLIAVRLMPMASEFDIDVVTCISWPADVISGNWLSREKFLIYLPYGIVHVIIL